MRVLASPITALEVCGELTRYLGGQTQTVSGYQYIDPTGRLAQVDFGKEYERLDANPADLPMRIVTNEWVPDANEANGGHYKTIEGKNLGELCRNLKGTYGVDLNCHWESAEGPDAPWDKAGDYTAWQIIGPFAGVYTVHVEEYPISSVTVALVSRYEFDTCDGWGYEDAYGNWQNERYTRIDCYPRDAQVTVTFKDGQTVLSGSFDELEETLRKTFGDVYWDSDETPCDQWGPGYHKARLVIGGVGWDYDVKVLEDPVSSVGIQYLASGIERYEFDRDKQYGYDNGNGWVEQEWYRIDAWPRDDSDVTVSVWLRNGSSYSGTADEVRDAMQRDGLDIMGWHSDETPQNLWQSGNTYTAWLDVGGMSTNYEVSVVENPITSLSVDTVYHTIGVAEQYNPDEGWVKPVEDEDEYINCNPDRIHATAVKDGKTIRYDGNEGGFHGWLQENLGVDPGLHYAFIEPPREWSANAGYQARLTLGPEDAPILTADYTVMLFENPIQRIAVNPLTVDFDQRIQDWSYRVPGDGPFGGFWVPSDGPWQRLDVIPEITVTLTDGTTDTGPADEVFERLNASNQYLPQPALQFSLIMDETPMQPWYGGEHEAYFVIGTVGYYFPVTVEGPIQSISVADVTRPVNMRSNWTDYYDYTTNSWHYDEERPWRVDAAPETLTITLKDDYSFVGGAQTMTFTNSESGGCLDQAAQALTRAFDLPFELRWNSSETPNARWQAGTDGDAWVEIVGVPVGNDAHYTVHVTNAVTRVALVADGPVQDGGFNQDGYDAASAFCETNQLEFIVFTPFGSKESRDIVQLAADLGYNVIVAVGSGFASPVAELAPDFPNARFILLDETPTDAEHQQIPANAVGVTYREEQAGYMAGYAAVKLGYHKLGFLGGMEVPGVVRYGIGFVQGAQAAATELSINDLSINYAYSGTFWSEYWIRDAMDGWYAGGTQLVFACGGGVWESVAAAAASKGGKIIGVDVDQAAEIDSMYGEGLTVTSAMKGVGASATAQLNAVLNGSFAGGTAVKLGVVSANPDENGVRLAPSTQFGTGFTAQDYAALVASIASSNPVSDDISRAPTSFSNSVVLCEIQPESGE